MLTCFSPLSRNRTVGYRIGQGEKLAGNVFIQNHHIFHHYLNIIVLDIEASMDEVAEGVPTAFAAVKLLEKYPPLFY